MTKFHLYLKKHNITNLKYLGMTTRNPFEYYGSGTYWKRHLKVHGKDISTIVLGTYKTREELSFWGIYYSNLWKIVENPEFANQIIEDGSGGGGHAPKSETHKRRISSSHIGLTHSSKSKEKISNYFAKKWKIVFPNGYEEVITNLNKWCKDHNLPQSNMVKGKYKGYKCYRFNEEIEEIKDWLNSKGFDFEQLYTTTGCKDYKLKVRIEYCDFLDHFQGSKPYKFQDIQKLEKEDGCMTFIVYENEWKNRKDQVKNFLLGALGKPETTLYARKCEIEVKQGIDSTILNFLNLYHIQGRPHSYEFSISLKYEGELIGVMTFGKHHRYIKDEKRKTERILSRLCWKTGYKVIGGAKRMFSYVPKDRDIISWSDNRWSYNGGVYQRLGFDLKSEENPAYDYINNNRDFRTRQSMRKDKIGASPDEKEEDKAKELGFHRIYDCGKKTWIYKAQRPESLPLV